MIPARRAELAMNFRCLAAALEEQDEQLHAIASEVRACRVLLGLTAASAGFTEDEVAEMTTFRAAPVQDVVIPDPER